MAPHFVRALSAYGDVRIRSFYHARTRTNARTHTSTHTYIHTHARTHTHAHAYTHARARTHMHARTHVHARMHTLQIHALPATDWYNEKKQNEKSVCRREEVGFQF